MKNMPDIYESVAGTFGQKCPKQEISPGASEIGKILSLYAVDGTKSILEPYSKLNEKGKKKAVEYTNDLTQIAEYTKPDTTDESNS